jgi:excisionase family DNA binding protein
MPPLAVSVQQAAELLGVSTFTVRRNIQKGLLRAVRIGRRVVVPIDSVHLLLGDPQYISSTAAGGVQNGTPLPAK